MPFENSSMGRHFFLVPCCNSGTYDGNAKVFPLSSTTLLPKLQPCQPAEANTDFLPPKQRFSRRLEPTPRKLPAQTGHTSRSQTARAFATIAGRDGLPLHQQRRYAGRTFRD